MHIYHNTDEYELLVSIQKKVMYGDTLKWIVQGFCTAEGVHEPKVHEEFEGTI